MTWQNEFAGSQSHDAFVFNNTSGTVAPYCVYAPLMRCANRLGSKEGRLTIARISPVDGRRARTAPRVVGPNRWSPSDAACWASGSRVVSIRSPPS